MNATTTQPGGSLASRKYRLRWWTLAVLCLSLLIVGLDNTILNVAIPTLQREFGATASELQWMVEAYVVVFAGLLLTLGALGDRLGRARALRAGLILFGVCSLAAAYAGSAGQLIAARALMGIGGALIMPATLSVLTDVFPREERGRAIAIWSGVSGLGIGLGPLAGGFLLEHFWWGSVFLVNVPIVLVALAAGPFLVPESRDPHPAALDVTGALLSIAAISTLVYGVIEAPHRGWADPRSLAAFGAGAALAVAFALWELRTDHPMLDLAFFRNRRFSAGSAAIALTFFALFGAVFALTQYLQFVRGYSPLEAGVRLTPLALGVMLGAGASNALADRLGTTRVVSGGMLIVAGALASMAAWAVATPYWVLGSTIFVLALGMGNVISPATEAVMGAVPEARAGIGSAMNDVTRQVAGAFGVAIVGSLVSTVYADRMAAPTATLPAPAAEPARDSVGAALAVAERLGGPAAEALAAAARQSFVDALGIAVLVSAGVLLLATAAVARLLPARHLPAPLPAPATGRSRSEPAAATG